MRRSFFLALSAIALVLSACDSAGNDGGDAGADSGTGGHDAGTPGHDAGTPDSGSAKPDAGPTNCTTGCSWVELALGSGHSCVRRENGEVWCWGRNKEGQLGDNRHSHQDCGLDSDGMPIDCSSVPVEVTVDGGGTLDDALQISAEGALSTGAVREGGELFCWGYEEIARTASDMLDYRFQAVRVETFGEVSAVSDGWLHVCMIQGADDRVVCFGDNESGELGVDRTDPIRVPMTSLAVLDPADTSMPLTGVDEVVAPGFGSTTCARVGDQVLCWGSDRDGQLGDGNAAAPSQCGPSGSSMWDCSLTPVVVGGADTPFTGATRLAAGISHVCALTTGGTVACWGDNRGGQLALPDTTTKLDVPMEIAALTDVAEVAAAGYTTCARKTDGTVWCWGFNDQGQLGDAVTSHESCSFGTSGGGSETGDCSHAPVQVMGIDDATHIDVGNSHACAIRESGQIWCWGFNSNRQLGDGSRDRRYAPVRVIGLPD